MDGQVSQEASPKLGLVSVLILALMSAAVSGVVAYSVASSMQRSTEIPFVVLDSSRILTASVAALRAGRYTEAEAIEAAIVFSDSLNAATERFVSAGYVVLNKGSVVGVSTQLDITEMVASDLGLTLE